MWDFSLPRLVPVEEVVLHQGGGVVYVELDGCRRILFGNSGQDRLARASPALVRLLSH